jgi:hypothetical protein
MIKTLPVSFLLWLFLWSAAAGEAARLQDVVLAFANLGRDTDPVEAQYLRLVDVTDPLAVEAVAAPRVWELGTSEHLTQPWLESRQSYRG